MYAAYLATTHALDTIRSMLAAVGWIHKINHLPDPTQAFSLKRVLIGIGKTTPSAPKQFHPVTYSLLLRILAVLPQVTDSSFQLSLHTSIFTLAYFACLRVGEYAKSGDTKHCIIIENVLFHTREVPIKVQITLPTFKHSLGAETFMLTPSLSREACPVTALRTYLCQRPLLPGPLFIHKNGSPVSRNAVSSLLRKSVQRLDLDPSQFSPHSFRIGRATDLANDGVPEFHIKKTGRWHSDAYLKYLRFDVFHLPPPPGESLCVA